MVNFWPHWFQRQMSGRGGSSSPRELEACEVDELPLLLVLPLGLVVDEASAGEADLLLSWLGDADDEA